MLFHYFKIKIFRNLRSLSKNGFGKFAIISKTTNKIIGYCGFEMCTIDGKDEAELGFRLIKIERGRGYVVEAATALIEDMKNRNFKYVIAFSEKDNTPAHNLLNKLGFSETFKSNFMNMDVVFFKMIF